jgi:hypothetical protein
MQPSRIPGSGGRIVDHRDSRLAACAGERGKELSRLIEHIRPNSSARRHAHPFLTEIRQQPQFFVKAEKCDEETYLDRYNPDAAICGFKALGWPAK